MRRSRKAERREMKKRAADNRRAAKRAAATAKAAIKSAKKAVEPFYGAASTTKDLVGFELMFESGICESVPGRFCRTIEFGDVSYADERRDVKDRLYDIFCQLYSYFPPRSSFQLNLCNFATDSAETVRYLEETGEARDLARFMNDMLEQKQREGRTDIERRNFFTFSVDHDDLKDAEVTLASLREGALKYFGRLGAKARALDGSEKLRLSHALLRGRKEPFTFDYSLLGKDRSRARDWVAPSWAAYEPDDKLKGTLVFPHFKARTYWIRDFGSDLSDRAIASIRALPIPMNISLLFCPQVKSKSIQDIKTNINAVQGEIFRYQAQVTRQGGDFTILPPSLSSKEADATELLDFVVEKDQLVNWFQGLITVYAEDDEAMKSYDRALRDEASTWSVDLVDMPMRQEEALISAMPLATTRLPKCFRSLTTAEAAAMIPFSSQTRQDDPSQSLLLGQDAITNKLLFVDLATMKSKHAWIMGITGAGKGMALNEIMTFSQLQHPIDLWDERKGRFVPSDRNAPQWEVFDFHSEYSTLGAHLGAAVTKFGPGHEACLNPLAMSNDAGALDARAVRSDIDFFLALTQNVLGREITQRERSMVDRCMNIVYQPHIGKDTRPVLSDLYECFRAQENDTADYLADSFEIFVKGSMNAFDGQTNVEDNPWMNVYDMSELGQTMQTFAMLSAMQHVKQKAYRNFREGRITYVVIEEVQVLFDNDAAVRVLDSFFSEMRKYGMRIICVTQLPKRVLEHHRAQYLFDNSGLFVFLANSPDNVALISEKFKLSETQEECMSLSVEKGSGLAIIEGVKVQIKNNIPRKLETGEDNLLYEIWNTDPDRNVAQETKTLKTDEGGLHGEEIDADPDGDGVQ